MYGRDFAECEYAWVYKGGTRIYKKSPNQPERIHPTQKPVALYKWILDKYAKPGDKILDTHLGSGSIAIACHDYGFDLTACELDKEYFDKAMQRINNHTNQLNLFK
jgi:site-specific DNA-methyltransferase (adenine-specific)